MRMPFSAPDPPAYLDDDVRVKRTVDYLAMELCLLNPDDRLDVLAYMIGELFFTAAASAEIYTRNAEVVGDGDAWRGSVCESGTIVGFGTIHECRSEQMSGGQQYINIGR